MLKQGEEASRNVIIQPYTYNIFLMDQLGWTNTGNRSMDLPMGKKLEIDKISHSKSLMTGRNDLYKGEGIWPKTPTSWAILSHQCAWMNGLWHVSFHVWTLTWSLSTRNWTLAIDWFHTDSRLVCSWKSLANITNWTAAGWCYQNGIMLNVHSSIKNFLKNWKTLSNLIKDLVVVPTVLFLKKHSFKIHHLLFRNKNHCCCNFYYNILLSLFVLFSSLPWMEMDTWSGLEPDL